MSVMLFRPSSSSFITLAAFWNCLPTVIARRPASSVSLREQRDMSHRVLATSCDTGERARVTAPSTSPLQMSNSLPSEEPISAHPGLDDTDSTAALSKFTPPSREFPISNTESLRPASERALLVSAMRSPISSMAHAMAANATDSIREPSASIPDHKSAGYIGTASRSGAIDIMPSLGPSGEMNGLSARSFTHTAIVAPGIAISTIPRTIFPSIGTGPNRSPMLSMGRMVIMIIGITTQTEKMVMHGTVREAL